MTHRLMPMLLGALCISLLWAPPLRADPITQTSGLAAKDPADNLTWRHIMATRLSTVGSGLNTNGYGALTLGVVIGCTGAGSISCGPVARLSPGVDNALNGNNTLMVSSYNYGLLLNGSGWARFRVGDGTGNHPLEMSANTGIQYVQPLGGSLLTFNNSLSTDPTNGPNGDAISDFRFGARGGPMHVVPHIIQEGGVWSRIHSAGKIGLGGTQACNGCLATGQYLITGNGTNVRWRADHGATSQGLVLFNTETTGAANTAVTAAVPAAIDSRGHIYKISARCSAGVSKLTVTNGVDQIWSTADGEVTATTFSERWQPGLTGSDNTTMTVTLSTCGAGNTGTLIVQADRF